MLETAGFEVLEIKSIWHNYILSATVRKRSASNISAFAEKHGLKVVPTVYRLDFGGVVAPRDVNHLLNIANNLNYDNGTPAEGIVWRSMCETHSDVLKGRLSFKTISNRYLEKYKE